MAAFEAVFVSGDPRFVDYTPGADVPAGEVIPLLGAAAAGGVGIPHLDMKSGVLGAVAIADGVYSVPGDAAIALGTLVYWNDTSNQAKATSTGNRQLGYAITACTGAAARFNVYVQPA